MSIQQPKFELRDEDALSLDLIEAQYALKDSQDKKNAKSVLILVSGIELAGKGEAVKQLREWLDPRYLRVKADATVINDLSNFLAVLYAFYSCRRSDRGDVWELVQ